MVQKRLEIWVMPSGNVAYYRGSEYCPKERLTNEEKKFILKHVFDDLQETEQHMCEAMCPPEDGAVLPKFKIGDTLTRPGWADHTVDYLYENEKHPENNVYVCTTDEGLESHIPFNEQDEWTVKEEKKVPNSVAEALHALDELLGSYEKLYILEHGAIGVHHTIGRAIRNEWGFWCVPLCDDNSETTPLVSELMELGFTHPDDMSNYILEQYVELLKKKIHV